MSKLDEAIKQLDILVDDFRSRVKGDGSFSDVFDIEYVATLLREHRDGQD